MYPIVSALPEVLKKEGLLPASFDGIDRVQIIIRPSTDGFKINETVKVGKCFIIEDSDLDKRPMAEIKQYLIPEMLEGGVKAVLAGLDMSISLDVNFSKKVDFSEIDSKMKKNL